MYNVVMIVIVFIVVGFRYPTKNLQQRLPCWKEGKKPIYCWLKCWWESNHFSDSRKSSFRHDHDDQWWKWKGGM